ncbi:hypothetical protein AWENTII_006019 [Aspergillus wentii]|nr:hypothetical protein MW887_000100 [Aspergillus wentii]
MPTRQNNDAFSTKAQRGSQVDDRVSDPFDDNDTTNQTTFPSESEREADFAGIGAHSPSNPATTADQLEIDEEEQ